jgi:hypothetical protein
MLIPRSYLALLLQPYSTPRNTKCKVQISNMVSKGSRSIALYCQEAEKSRERERERKIERERKVFLGAFAKLQKATISVVMPVRPSARLCVRVKQLDSHWEDFYEIWYLRLYGNLLRKFTFHYNPTKKTGTSHDDFFTFMIISRWIRLRMRNVTEKRFCRENQNTFYVQ